MTRPKETWHNAIGEIVTIVDGDGNVGTVDHDQAGRRLEHCDPNGEVTAYSYDVRGLLVETVVTVPGDGDRPGVCETATPTITGTSGSKLLVWYVGG